MNTAELHAKELCVIKMTDHLGRDLESALLPRYIAEQVMLGIGMAGEFDGVEVRTAIIVPTGMWEFAVRSFDRG